MTTTDSHLEESDNTCFYPINKYVSSSYFLALHCAYLHAISSITLPKSFAQTVTYEHFHKAMQFEIDALDENQTWNYCHTFSQKESDWQSMGLYHQIQLCWYS